MQRERAGVWDVEGSAEFLSCLSLERMSKEHFGFSHWVLDDLMHIDLSCFAIKHEDAEGSYRSSQAIIHCPLEGLYGASCSQRQQMRGPADIGASGTHCFQAPGRDADQNMWGL